MPKSGTPEKSKAEGFESAKDDYGQAVEQYYFLGGRDTEDTESTKDWIDESKKKLESLGAKEEEMSELYDAARRRGESRNEQEQKNSQSDSNK